LLSITTLQKDLRNPVEIKIKKDSGEHPKTGETHPAPKNDKFIENGLEHFQEVEVEIYRREIPSFSVRFNIEDSSTSSPPNLADYNELSEVSEEYFDSFFRSVFEDVKVRHDGTVLFLMVSEDDPFTVDFKMTLEFIIPGEVPTINFLIDRLQDGLERETSRAFFISDLSSMSETNPFSKTVSFEVVSRPPVSAAEVGGGKQPPNGSIQNASKQHVLISLLGGLGCIALVGAGVLWKKKKLSESNSLTLDNNSAMDKSDGIYGADEETMSYLNYIRKRYRDHDKSNKVPSSDSNNDNIAAVEQTGSYDDGEDSICNTVDSGSDNENKDADGLEDDLRSIY